MGRDGGDQDETATLTLFLHLLNCELCCEVGSEDLGAMLRKWWFTGGKIAQQQAR